MWKALIRLMMVDLPEPDGPTRRGDGAGLRAEADVEQHGLAGFVGEADVFEKHFAVDGAEGYGAVGVLVFGAFFQNFMGAVEAG